MKCKNCNKAVKLQILSTKDKVWVHSKTNQPKCDLIAEPEDDYGFYDAIEKIEESLRKQRKML